MKKDNLVYSIPVKQLPVREQPRELFDCHGAENVSDSTLLAILLRKGIPGKNVTVLADELMQRFGSLSNMAKQSVQDLQAVKGVGKVGAQVLKCALERAVRMGRETARPREKILTPAQAADQVRLQARTLNREVFWVLMLNIRNELKGPPVEVSRGLLDASLVHARDVFKQAIQSGSQAVVLLHNHPSGDPSPSKEDVALTRQLVEAGKIIGIRVLDHVIVGHRKTETEQDYISLRESGLVEFERD